MAKSDNSKDRVGSGYFTHAISRSVLKKGDHIIVNRSWFPFYTHHGIYTGADPKHEVIHLSGRSRSKKSDAKVRTCTLDEFLDGGQLRLVAYGHTPTVAELLIVAGVAIDTTTNVST